MHSTSFITLHRILRIFLGMCMIPLAALLVHSTILTIYLALFFRALSPDYALSNLLLLALTVGAITSVVSAPILIAARISPPRGTRETIIASIHIIAGLVTYAYFSQAFFGFLQIPPSIVAICIYAASAILLLIQRLRAPRPKPSTTALSVILALLTGAAMVLFPPLIFFAPFIVVGALISLLIVLLVRKFRRATPAISGSHLIE